jgi:hypothetical protein
MIDLRLPEGLSLWSPGAGSRLYSQIVVNDQVIPAQCEGVVMARMKSSLGV